jgi:hypothetical protein
MPETEPAETLAPEQRARMEAWLAAHPYGDQDENGVDLASLRRNLQLTPTERLHRLQTAVQQYWEIRRNATYSR